MSDRARGGGPDFGHLEGVSTEPVHGQARPQLQPEFPFTDVGDVLEGHDLLRKRQVKQLLSMTERILEVRATTSGSDIIVASFTESSFDLTEVAGRHGIKFADQASCAGWDPLSSSGRQRFWHVHCTLAPKLIIYSLPVAVQQWLSVSNPSELSLQPHFRSTRDQLRLCVKGMRWQHMQGRYFHTSKLPGSWTLVQLQVLLDGSQALLTHTPRGMRHWMVLMAECRQMHRASCRVFVL